MRTPFLTASVLYFFVTACYAQTSLDVTAFGAKCDGNGNDTSAFNLAISSASKSGDGIVNIPNGTCIIGGAAPLKLLSNIWLRGNSRDKSILKSAATITKCKSKSDAICMLIQIGGDGGGAAKSVKLSDFTIDSGNFETVGSGAISINGGASDISIERVRIINMSQFGISVSNSNRWRIVNNEIIKSKRPTKGNKYSQIEAILVVASGESRNGLIANNLLRGAGMDIAAHDSVITENVVADWTFGAGITTEQSEWCHDLTITNNVIHGGVGQDVNDTTALGIENWCRNSIVSGNVVFGNSGEGINIGGQNNIVANNTIYDNGTYREGFSGLSARYDGAIYNANNSIFFGNKSFNTEGTSGPQVYGYSEQSRLLKGIRLVGNSFEGNKAGPIKILSPTTEVDRMTR